MRRDYLIVAALLALFATMAVTSMLRKSATFDEPLHLAGGYAYWTQNDYRLSAENGNFAQRWVALPLLFGEYHFPLGTPSNFRSGFDFLFNAGNDAGKILMQGRAMMILLGMALGVLVYCWSRELFGRPGGLLSLALYSFSPTILAHTRLATSDLAVALFFTLSLWCIWKMLQRVTIARIICCGLAIGALFVSKMSAILIIPMALALTAVRLLWREPLPVVLGKVRSINSRPRQAQIFVVLFILEILLVVGVVQAFYGFTFSVREPAPSLPAERPADRKTAAVEEKKEEEAPPAKVREVPLARGKNFVNPRQEPPWVRHFIKFARDYQLVPEAYLRGLQVVARYSLVRPAFFNGRHGTGGWFWFFPYCFLVKTPLPLFLLLLLGGMATVFSWRRINKEEGSGRLGMLSRGLYRTSPLWILLVIYWVTAVNTNLNIGQRHILPVYPATFILAGSAAFWLTRRYLAVGLAVAAAGGYFVVESVMIWPNYLAYFNPVVGGPRHGYQHLVDSSLDWGQDLPQLKAWLDQQGLNNDAGTPVYLSYFGNGNPSYYQIKAKRLPGHLDLDAEETTDVRLKGGVYCISATMLQMVPIYPNGHWSRDYEREYQSLAHAAFLDVSYGKSRAARARSRRIPEDIMKKLHLFPRLQLGRLCAYLRSRQPDAYIGYSILVYRLSNDEIRQALFRPPAELVDEEQSS